MTSYKKISEKLRELNIQELSEFQIFKKIKHAIMEHTQGSTTIVRYDVYNQEIYVDIQSEYKQDEDVHSISEIFRIEHFENEYDLLCMLDTTPNFITKDKNGLNDRERIKLILKDCSIYEWKCYDEIRYAIQKAKRKYVKFLERQKMSKGSGEIWTELRKVADAITDTKKYQKN